MLDNLNRAEKLGLLLSVIDWLDARNLRSRLVHEYIADPEAFASMPKQAHALVPLLVATYNAIRRCQSHCRVIMNSRLQRSFHRYELRRPNLHRRPSGPRRVEDPTSAYLPSRLSDFYQRQIRFIETYHAIKPSDSHFL